MFEKIRKCETMPYDKVFYTKRGEDEELCHATGQEVLFEGDPVWYAEYIDSDGNLYYGN